MDRFNSLPSCGEAGIWSYYSPAVSGMSRREKLQPISVYQSKLYSCSQHLTAKQPFPVLAQIWAWHIQCLGQPAAKPERWMYYLVLSLPWEKLGAQSFFPIIWYCAWERDHGESMPQMWLVSHIGCWFLYCCWIIVSVQGRRVGLPLSTSCWCPPISVF